MIKNIDNLNDINYLDINSTTSYKYIRYIPPNKNNTDINPIKLYGFKITEENINEEKNFQVTNLPLISITTENSVEPITKEQDIN